MKKLLVVFCCLVACRTFAADGLALFQIGLKTYQENGADALLNTWYSTRDDADKIAALRTRLNAATRHLGTVVDTEVFTPRNLGKNVQRLYGVIYFEKKPLWIRAEFYAVGGRSGFISLEFSHSPDEILPLAWVALPP
ncbi:MAG: hypothetical protein NTV51_19635 [Verrucomicrobia bacterium]|nr:hypothetical protein [Verrucomicrobiota bacterium]